MQQAWLEALGIDQRAVRGENPSLCGVYILKQTSPTLTIPRSLFQIYLLVNMHLTIKFSKHLLRVYCVPGTVLSILYALSHWHLYQFPHNHMKEALLLFSFYRREAKEADTEVWTLACGVHTVRAAS